MESEFSQKSEGNLIIIKGRFKSTIMNQYGFFLLTLNSLKKIENLQVIVASSSDIFDIDPNTPWDKIEEDIVDRKWKGNYDNSITTSVSNALNKLQDDAKNMNSLHESAYNYDYDRMDFILYDTINGIIHDKNLVLETILQEITQQELQIVRDNRAKPQEQNEETKAENKDDGNTILKIKPVLAPINGKPIYELRIGDKIMVTVIPGAIKENNYIDINDLWDEKKGIKHIPATVIDIKSSLSKNSPIEIMTEINSGVYGLCLEDEKLIKLKLYTPEADSLPKESERIKSPQTNPYSKKKNKPNTSIIVMAMFLIFILLVFVIFIMIM